MANEKRLIDASIMPNGQFWDGLTDKEKSKVLTYLIMSPTVDAVEVVHGYWIDSTTVNQAGRITGYGIDCSVCDSVFKDGSRAVVQHWKEKFKVCPFCGALMDGGNDG